MQWCCQGASYCFGNIHVDEILLLSKDSHRSATVDAVVWIANREANTVPWQGCHEPLESSPRLRYKIDESGMKEEFRRSFFEQFS